MQDYRTWVRHRRHRPHGGEAVQKALELERTQKRREQKWKDHVRHLRQVEHALLDALPTTSSREHDDHKTAALVCCRIHQYLQQHSMLLLAAV